jgi:hypothetical protein
MNAKTRKIESAMMMNRIRGCGCAPDQSDPADLQFVFIRLHSWFKNTLFPARVLHKPIQTLHQPFTNPYKPITHPHKPTQTHTNRYKPNINGL